MRYIIVILLLATAAHARDSDGRYANSPYKAWYAQQHNSAGLWCCDQADGHQFYGEYSFNSDGSVTVKDAGQTYKIEKYKVLTGANPTGAAVWWFVDSGGGRMTYCFAPGTLS